MVAPFLSLALATYNGWHELEPVMRALLPQLADDVELIICDNASPDGTADKAEILAAGCPGVRVVRHKENVGAVLNFRDAIEAAQGEYVMLLADDDLPSVHFLDFVRDLLSRRPSMGIYHFAPTPEPEPLRVYEKPPGSEAMALIFSHSGMIPGITFPKRLFTRALWPHDGGEIYPQVFLALNLGRDHGAVLTKGPQGIVLGGMADSTLSRARGRPTDYGIGERFRHLEAISKPLPPEKQYRLHNRGANDLLSFGWTVYDELRIEDKGAANRFLTSLIRLPSVHASPLLIITWLRHARGRSGFALHTAPRMAGACLRGFLTGTFWRRAAAWLSERRLPQARTIP